MPIGAQRVVLTAVACLAVCAVGLASAALQLTLEETSDGAQAYLVPNGTRVSLLCNSSSLLSGGNYVWTSSSGNSNCGDTALAENSTRSQFTLLTTVGVICYKCTYRYTDTSITPLVSNSLLLYPFSSAAPVTADLATTTSANLTCSTAGLSPTVNVSFVWTRVSTGSAALSGSVSAANASTLVVENSSAAGDLYYCHGVPMNGVGIYGYKTNGVAGALLATFYVAAPPYSEIYPYAQKQYTEGDSATVVCKVLGYPILNVTWQREGAPFSPLSVQNVSITGGMNVSFKITSLNAVSDRGAYVCIASGLSNGSSYSYLSKARTLHARSKLAPLWPAIGILAQLAAVAIIIGVTESLQAKKVLSAGSKGDARNGGSKK